MENHGSGQARPMQGTRPPRPGVGVQGSFLELISFLLATQPGLEADAGSPAPESWTCLHNTKHMCTPPTSPPPAGPHPRACSEPSFFLWRLPPFPSHPGEGLPWVSATPLSPAPIHCTGKKQKEPRTQGVNAGSGSASKSLWELERDARVLAWLRPGCPFPASGPFHPVASNMD